MNISLNTQHYWCCVYVHSVQQKSSGLKFTKFQMGSDVTYSCHHNSSHFTFPTFVYLWFFSVFHSFKSISPVYINQRHQYICLHWS